MRFPDSSVELVKSFGRYCQNLREKIPAISIGVSVPVPVCLHFVRQQQPAAQHEHQNLLSHTNIHRSPRNDTKMTSTISYETALGASLSRTHLNQDGPSMPDQLPSVNFNFDDLREHMNRFTSRFDEFIEKGRKRVLEERNQFRMNVTELQGMRRPPYLLRFCLRFSASRHLANRVD